MASAHSKTSNTKSQGVEILIPKEYQAAWESMRGKTLDDYRREGWLTTNDLLRFYGIHCIKSLKSRVDGKTESFVHVFRIDGVNRKLRLYRPLIS
jgi:hypothetical protein